MILKAVPEDFIVIEQPNRTWEKQGKFLIVKVKKKLYNTEDVAFELAKHLHISRKNVSYAGTKDRQGITSQFFSLKGVQESQVNGLSLNDIAVEVVGFSNEPLSLGDLKGNQFIITVRGLAQTSLPQPIVVMPNYFDSQRFGMHNDKIGKLFVKRDFKGAADLIIEAGGRSATSVQEALEKQPTNVIGALRTIPKKILSLYVHAYQSLLFNNMLRKLEEQLPLKELVLLQLPLVGFGTEEPKEPIRSLYETVLADEAISPRDFIIREFPDITSEGILRPATVPVDNLVIGGLEHDENNIGMQKCTVSFMLPRGAYATMVIKYLFKE